MHGPYPLPWKYFNATLRRLSMTWSAGSVVLNRDWVTRGVYYIELQVRYTLKTILFLLIVNLQFAPAAIPLQHFFSVENLGPQSDDPELLIPYSFKNSNLRGNPPSRRSPWAWVMPLFCILVHLWSRIWMTWMTQTSRYVSPKKVLYEYWISRGRLRSMQVNIS